MLIRRKKNFVALFDWDNIEFALISGGEVNSCLTINRTKANIFK